MWNLNVKTSLKLARREGMLLQATLLQACCVILMFLIISVVSMVSLIIYLSQCTHAMTSGMTWADIMIVSPDDIITGCEQVCAKLVTRILSDVGFNCGKMCRYLRVIKEHDFLQDVKSREREQWARDFDKVIQHPRIVESMFVQKWWTQRFFAAETETARNCKVTVCNQLLLLSSNAEIHVREALEWLFSTVNCHFIQTMLPDYLRSMSWLILHCAVPRNKDDRNGMIPWGPLKRYPPDTPSSPLQQLTNNHYQN